jgi:hypothetical protein
MRITLHIPESLGSWTLFIVRNSKSVENTATGKLELFPSSGKGKETPTLLGPLETAYLNHWTIQLITAAANAPVIEVSCF